MSAFTATAAPPSDADIERLLTASRAQGMLDAILPQMEAMQRQQFEQITAGKDLSAEQKAEIERLHARTSDILRRSLSWEEMRPLYIDVYKKTFTREDVKAMAKFYESPAGKSLLDKTPPLMQNLMGAVQQKVLPLLEAAEDRAGHGSGGAGQGSRGDSSPGAQEEKEEIARYRRSGPCPRCLRAFVIRACPDALIFAESNRAS